MISNKEEINQALILLGESRAELKREGKDVIESIEVGIMIEIPSAAIMAREIAPMVDFFSIGTNDLIQYTLAVDRGNQRVSKLYQSYNPAVLKLINMTIEAAHFAGIWCGLCGEMAADPRATAMLVGMGLDEFSVNPPAVPRIKGIIRSIKISDARRIAQGCLRFADQEGVLSFLDTENKKIVPEELMLSD
jgi:phosphotransferase system enzyme I (PtsI)